MRFVSVVVLAAMSALPAAAGLIGETIVIDRVIPSQGFDYNVYIGQTGQYTVGVSAPVSLSLGNNLYARATDTDLIVDFGPGSGSGGGVPDNAIIFSDLFLGTGISVTGVNVVFNDVPGLSASDVSFTSSSVTIGTGNADYAGGQLLDLALVTSGTGVPEPGTLGAVFFGLGLTALGLRRKRR